MKRETATGSGETKPDALEAMLDLGAVAAPGTALGQRRDALTARAYTHPGLEGRTVVRLVPEALGQAEDLTMSFLGFADLEQSTEVGVVRTQTLGFPAWALVHDPANSHHALNLVKDIERLGQLAKSKPGRAKRGFDELAGKLADSVPHFLPTFYEQAGREFIEAGNTPSASSYFTRARDAERAYGLKIDEDSLAASVLEFALAGALSVKSLSAYLKNLTERATPGEAYARYRQVCVGRVAGGQTPHGGMIAELKKLAAAAGLDPVSEDVALARDLLPLEAMTKATDRFWANYKPTLVAAAHADAEVRGLLLGLLPRMQYEEGCPEADRWLELLDECGATAGLTEPVEKLDPAELPAEGAAGWLTRYVRHFYEQRGTSWYYGSPRKPGRAILDLIERMADRLRADDAELTLCEWQDADIDLIDLCLSLGLRVAAPGKEFTVPLAEWLTWDGFRELDALAADERLRPHLYSEVDRIGRGRADGSQRKLPKLSHPEHAQRVAEASGLRSVVSDWLAHLAETTVAAGIADVEVLLEVWLRNAEPRVLAANPEAVCRVIELDVATYLGHALRSGIFDEYGWPALENACAEIASTQAEENEKSQAERPEKEVPRWAYVAQWPYLIVRMGDDAAVVGHDRTVLEHRLSLPKLQQGSVFPNLRFADGQMLVAWASMRNIGAYWTGDPAALVDTQGMSIAGQHDSLELPGGGRTFGGTPLTVGSVRWTAQHQVASDGDRYWALRELEHQRNVLQWHVFDPETGELGAEGKPDFFMMGAVEGAQLMTGSWLVPTVAGAQLSPLGTADGLLGARTYKLPDGTCVCTRVDGPARILPETDYYWSHLGMVGLLDIPGRDPRLAVVADNTHHLIADGSRRIATFSPGEQAPKYAKGTWCVPPFRLWNFLTVRDEAGSAALRALSDSVARALVTDGGMEQEAAVDAVSKHLTQVTKKELRAGVAGYVTVAAHCEAKVNELTAALKESAATPEQPASDEFPMTWSAEFRRVREGLMQSVGEYEFPIEQSPLAVLRLLNRGLTGEPMEEDAEQIDRMPQMLWFGIVETLLNLPALAMRAVSPAVGEADREVLLTYLDALGETALVAPGSAIRKLHLTPDDPKASPARGHGIPTEHGRVFLLDSPYGSMQPGCVRNAFEYSRDGRFSAIPGWKISHERRAQRWPCTEPLGAFAQMARARGVISPASERAGQLSELSGMSSLEATVLFAGLPTSSYAYHEKTPPEVLEILGAKPTAVQRAELRFRGLSQSVSAGDVVALLLPENIDELWDAGPRLDGVAELWISLFGKQDPLPQRLYDLAEKESAPTTVQALLSPGAVSCIDRTTSNNVMSGGLGLSVYCILWLAYRLPCGDPLRARLPEALARLRKEIFALDFAVQLSPIQDAEKFASTHGYELKQDGEKWTAGPFTLNRLQWSYVWLHPARLSDIDDPAMQVAEALSLRHVPDFNALKLILSGQLDALVAVSGESVGETYAPQDPTRSTPELVTEVAKKYDLSEDAAALYLMLLALPDPTDRHQAQWLGWRPARLKAARAELAATDLVVSGARTRAGRSLFLPGAWLDFRSSVLPLEAWKGEMLGAVTPDGVLLVGPPMPRDPVPELYRAAWKRVQAGDGPRFEELTTGRSR